MVLSACLAAGSPVESPPSMVLVSLDTLRPDRLGAYGSTDGLSPNLDHFAREAIVFDHCYSQANETLFSHASMLTGRYASELDRITYRFKLPESIPTLPQVLGLYGYETAASVAGGHLHPHFGLNRGFDTYVIPREWGSLFHTVPRAMSWLDELSGQSPFFLFLHTYDNHHRYLKPSPYGFLRADPNYTGAGQQAVLSLMGTISIFDGYYFGNKEIGELVDFRTLRLRDERSRATIRAAGENPVYKAKKLLQPDIDFIRDVYDGSVAYVDAFFGLFMAAMEQRGLLDNTVIVVMSDHGESLGEHGLFNHRYSLRNEDTQTVLMIRLPGGKGGGRHVGSLTGLIDIMPTLLDFAGANPPADLRGHSLVPALRGQELPERNAIFTEGSFRMVSARNQDAFLVFSGISAGSPFIGDMIESADLLGPAFLASPGADLTTMEDLRSAMLEWRSRTTPPPSPNEEADPALIKALRQRGYWGLE